LADLGDAKVCLGPVNTITEAIADPQIQARGVVALANYGEREGEGRAFRSAPTISDVPFETRLGLPELGEHTDATLAGAGYSAEEIAALRRVGVVA
jgi:crotonobetainyl-CoA:carnitine CoA-transferase CaiB-like acyl-CoA transferase